MTSQYLKMLIEFSHRMFNLEGEEARMNTNEDNVISIYIYIFLSIQCHLVGEKH